MAAVQFRVNEDSDPPQHREITMSDAYQITAIVADAIRACHRDMPVDGAEPTAEHTACIAKAVITALNDAGLSIVPAATIDAKQST
jgi:hypothetical protein